MFEMHPWKVRRGGGAAIIVNSRFCTIEKLSIVPPKPLEAVWAIVKPKSNPGKFKQIIVFSFYAPPRNRKTSELLEHITCNLQLQLQKFPNAGIIIAGDRNNISIERLLTIDHSLHQIVTKTSDL